jgi:hypothetical protein
MPTKAELWFWQRLATLKGTFEYNRVDDVRVCDGKRMVTIRQKGTRNCPLFAVNDLIGGKNSGPNWISLIGGLGNDFAADIMDAADDHSACDPEIRKRLISVLGLEETSNVNQS